MPPTTPSLVALDHPPGPAWLELFEAIRARGDAVLPLDPHLGADGRQELLERMRPAELWTATERAPLPAPLPAAEDTAVVLMTSGTTGMPKGVELSQSALDAAARLTNQRLEARPGDRWLCCLPLHHVGGLGILGRAALLGTAPEIHKRFDLAAVGRSEAEFVSLVPTMLLRLLDADVALDGFKAILLGGARAPSRLLERALEAGARVIRTYGMTETTGGVVYDGVPLDGVDIDVDTEGRICLRTPTVMTRYRDDPEATAAVLRDGWYKTSDIGTLSDGRLQVLGRADDAILTGGEKVIPGYVESVLAEHPAVGDVAVIGVDDAEWGQRVAAFVVPTGGLPLDPADLRALVAERGARHMVPKEIVEVAGIPRLPTGKPDAIALRWLLGS